jgi:hypothetical protein
MRQNYNVSLAVAILRFSQIVFAIGYFLESLFKIVAVHSEPFPIRHPFDFNRLVVRIVGAEDIRIVNDFEQVVGMGGFVNLSLVPCVRHQAVTSVPASGQSSM